MKVIYKKNNSFSDKVDSDEPNEVKEKEWKLIEGILSNLTKEEK